MPLQATSGAASYDAFGGGVPVVPTYIEGVFSTYLYAGSNSPQTITNGIDLSTNGGLVWTKARTTTYDHFLTDTIRGGNKQLSSNNTGASVTSSPAEITSFNTTGYTLAGGTVENVAGQNFVGWTFRKQPKFFDVVTYTGTGSARTIAHNLGSTPGCIIVKRTDASIGWPVYHRGLTSLDFLLLDATSGSSTAGSFWDDTNPTSTNFTVGSSNYTNASGGTYVAYLFAHNAGGFGLTGTDNVISCGSFTTNGSGLATVNLGYEPQWLLMKATDASNWWMFDNMRNWSKSGFDELNPNLSAGESNYTSTNFSPTATGFQLFGNEYGASRTFIYIAIRRGPMKVPTVGTSVFTPSFSVGGFPSYVSPFPVDANINGGTTGSDKFYYVSRLTGTGWLYTTSTGAESTSSSFKWDVQNGAVSGWPTSYIGYNFRRAPSFFDVVCYTGLGYPTALTNTHNLGVAPEMMVVKNRSNTQSWFVYHSAMGNDQEMYLNQSASQQLTNFDWNSTTPSATTFTVNSSTNNSGQTYVAYLFATCAGVSKVGSYTGNGTTQTINCGFTTGARFVLIKRYDSTGNWYVYDTARGMTTLTDPYLWLNSSNAEVSTLGSVTTVSTGFALNSSILADINISSGNYIFLAIA